MVARTIFVVLGAALVLLLAFGSPQRPEEEPWKVEFYDKEPFLTGSISPEVTSVNEGSFAFGSITTFDKDTYRKYKSDGTSVIFQVSIQPAVDKVILRSSDVVTFAISSQDANSGVWKYTVVRRAKPVSSTDVFIDTFRVYDINSEAPVGIDPWVDVAQAVEIKNVP
jgi:hypothetical protein